MFSSCCGNELIIIKMTIIYNEEKMKTAGGKSIIKYSLLFFILLQIYFNYYYNYFLIFFY